MILRSSQLLYQFIESGSRHLEGGVVITDIANKGRAEEAGHYPLMCDYITKYGTWG